MVRKRMYRSFAVDWKFARSLGLKDMKEWIEYGKSRKISSRHTKSALAYLQRDLKANWGLVGGSRGKCRSFVKAKKYARYLKLKD